eukprot:jgi/Mesvir1/21076/Mv17229-RA.1
MASACATTMTTCQLSCGPRVLSAKGWLLGGSPLPKCPSVPSVSRPARRGSHLIVRMKAEERQRSVGFLGMGIMGKEMARNLVQSGVNVHIWSRNPVNCRVLEGMGARVASSPAEVTNNCDITFAMLSDPGASLEVAFMPKGAVEGLGTARGYIDCSTVDPSTAQRIGEAVNKAGGLFMEAPVSGSLKPAMDGELIFITAGDAPLLDRARPYLDIMGKATYYLGPVGQAARMKLVVNAVMGAMMGGFAEGLALTETLGLDADAFLGIISQGAIACPMFAAKGKDMTGERKYNPAFPLKHQQKDLRLALALAEQATQAMPVTAAANQLYISARNAGLGNKDFSAVLDVLRARADEEAVRAREWDGNAMP